MFHVQIIATLDDFRLKFEYITLGPDNSNYWYHFSDKYLVPEMVHLWYTE